MPDSGTHSLIPLPEFPLGLGGVYSPASVGMRRFGVSEDDLGIDFSAANSARLVTRLLELCAVDPSEILPNGVFRELSIGNRIECLLMLAAGAPDAALSFSFKCVNCDEQLEFDLTVSEVSDFQRQADLVDTVTVDVKGRRIEIRKPRGSDQENWALRDFADEAAATADMIGTLTVTPDLPSNIGTKEIRLIEDALDAADPLVNFSCNVTCGECGEPNEYAVDLLETALEMLSHAQRRLIFTVHRLASHYHWSEAEIFAVPDRRRQQYLNLIETTGK